MRLNLLGILMILAVLFSASCKKYEEGPGLSFISKKQRVANTWSFHSVIENDVDVTLDYNEAELELTKEGVLNYTYFKFENGKKTTFQETGKWNFESSKNRLVMIFKNEIGSNQIGFSIIELKNNSMHLKSDDLSKDWKLVTNYLR